MTVSPELTTEHRATGTGFGLDATTESVYQAVLDHPGVGTGRLAGLVARSEVTVRLAAERLAALDLLHRGPAPDSAGCDTWTAVEPEVGLAALLARQQSELAQHQQEVEGSRLTVARLLSTYGKRRSHDLPGVEWIAGAGTVRARTAELAAGCLEEFLSLRPAQSVRRPPGGVEDELAARGVRSRSIVLDSVRNDSRAMAELSREMDEGAEIRTLPTLPARVQVFDQRNALVSVTNLTGVAGELVVSCNAVVHSYVTLFGKLWAEAEPLCARRPQRGDSLSLQEVHILKLWAQGHTDASAARRMAVSLRTVRRLSDRLTERLGTRSRFQLGAVAITKKLIDPAEIL